MRRLILLLALVLLVTACSPSDQWRMWRFEGPGDYATWDPKELYSSKSACEAARSGLPKWHQEDYATLCVPQGLTPKDIGAR